MKQYNVSFEVDGKHGYEGLVYARNMASAYNKAVKQYREYLNGDNVKMNIEYNNQQ